MNKKLLLVGEFYSENLGDPLLCQTVKRTIEDAYPKMEVIPFDMSGKINATDYYPLHGYTFGMKLFFKLSSYFPFLFKKSALFRAYKTSEQRYLRMWQALNDLLEVHAFDCVVFAGGSLFMDYFAGIIYLIVKRFAFTKTKIIFHACGMSKLNNDSTMLLQKAFETKNVVHISLRDSYTRFLKLFHIGIPVTETYDTALSCSRYFDAATAPKAAYGVGLIANEQFYEYQKRLVRYFLDSSLSWKIFTNGASFDERFAIRILTDLNVSEEDIGFYLTKRPLTSKQLVYTVTGFEKIIAFRMHSQIVAASFGIPSFGFAWDHKLVDFYTKLGFPERYAEEYPKLTSLIDLLEGGGEHLREQATTQGAASQKSLLDAIAKACNQ